jgi:hypothetical protein
MGPCAQSLKRSAAMSKEKALELVTEFAARTKVAAFTQIQRAKVAEQLKVRVNNPMFVNQGSAGLCVPASIVYGLAQRKPLEYVDAVTKLYDYGGALISKWEIKPCADLKKAPCPGGVPEADWIILASIRDDENWFVDFESDEDNGGSTVRETKKWLELAGYKEIVDETDPWGWNKEKNLKESLEYYKKDYQVMWRICADMINSTIPKSPEANHRITLAGEFTVPPSKEDPIRIPIYSWGEKFNLPKTGGLKYGQFLEQYFGFLACKF